MNAALYILQRPDKYTVLAMTVSYGVSNKEFAAFLPRFLARIGRSTWDDGYG